MKPLARRTLFLLSMGVAASAFAVCVVEPYDPDMFHHLALGRDIARHGLRAEEPLLYPMSGVATGPMPYWLGSLAIHGWHALLGDAGLALLPAAAGALLLLLLLSDSAPRGGGHTPATLAAAALPLALALGAFRGRATARPELFAMLFLALTLWAVRRLEDGRPRPVAAFPLLALLWGNVHPSVLAGIGVVGLCAAVCAAERAASRLTGRARPALPSPRGVAIAAAATALGLLASAATPAPASPVAHGLAFAAAVFREASPAAASANAALPLVRAFVTEMKPPGAEIWLGPAGLLLVLTALSFALRWRDLRWREVLTFVVFAVLAARAARFTALFAIVSAPFAARNLGAALASLPAGGRLPWRAAAAAASLAAALATPLLARDPVIRSGTRLRPGAFPVRALDYLAGIGFDGRVFNSFQLGGYLEWRAVTPAFQDGRGLVPAGEAEASFRGPMMRATFAPLDEKYRFDALVLSPIFEHVRTAPVRPGEDWYADVSRFALVAFDDGGLVFLRRDGKYAGIAARDEYRWARPSTAPYLWTRDQVRDVLADYRRSVAEAPSCVTCRYFLGSAALAAGLPEEAARAVAPALEREDVQTKNLLGVAGKAAEALGRLDEARGHYARALSMAEDDPGLRAALERLRAAGATQGRAAEARALHDQGLAAYRSGDLAAAAGLYERSIRAFEPNPQAHSNLGYVHLGMGRIDEAVSEQRSAIEQAPGYAAAHYGLGMALARRGDPAGAAVAFREFLRLEPSGEWSAKAADWLQRLERP